MWNLKLFLSKIEADPQQHIWHAIHNVNKICFESCDTSFNDSIEVVKNHKHFHLNDDRREFLERMAINLTQVTCCSVFFVHSSLSITVEL